MYAAKILSGSTNGLPIPITTGGVTVHTSVAIDLTGVMDQVFLWATNIDSSPHTITFTIGGVSYEVTVPLPPNSNAILICPGLPANNSTIFRCVADADNFIRVAGYYFAVGY